jgi:hypothetical protein
MGRWGFRVVGRIHLRWRHARHSIGRHSILWWVVAVGIVWHDLAIRRRRLRHRVTMASTTTMTVSVSVALTLAMPVMTATLTIKIAIWTTGSMRRSIIVGTTGRWRSKRVLSARCKGILAVPIRIRATKGNQLAWGRRRTTLERIVSRIGHHTRCITARRSLRNMTPLTARVVLRRSRPGRIARIIVVGVQLVRVFGWGRRWCPPPAWAGFAV